MKAEYNARSTWLPPPFALHQKNGDYHGENVACPPHRRDLLWEVQRVTGTDRLPGRFEWMDAARGLAIMLVVLFHTQDLAIRVLGPDSALDRLGQINDGFQPARVPVLMVLSGMLLNRSMAKPKREYLIGKWSRIGWPYLLWSFAILGSFTLLAPALGFDADPQELLRILYDPPLYLWYLAYLLAYYHLALFLPPAMRLFLAFVAFVGQTAIVDYNLKRFLFLFAFFVLGDLIGRHFVKFRALSERGWVVWPALGVALSLGVLGSLELIHGAFNPIWSLAILGLVIALPSIFGLLDGSAPTLARAFGAVGRDSMVYYTTHYPVVALTISLLYVSGVRQPLIVVPVAVSVALLTGIVAVRLTRFPIVSLLFAWPRRKVNRRFGSL